MIGDETVGEIYNERKYADKHLLSLDKQEKLLDQDKKIIAKYFWSEKVW